MRRSPWARVSQVAAFVWSVAGAANAQLAEGCRALGEALVEHSCFHSTFGPFNSVQATPGETPTQTTPNVDPVHTEFRVGLPGAGTAHVVTYAPEREGAWIVFTNQDVEVTLLYHGVPVTSIMDQSGGTGCAALAFAQVYELERARYTVHIAPTEADSLVLVIEYGADFLVPSGVDADGDGYGSPDDTVLTNCTPAAGRAANASDCDDTDSSIHPGATELCDDVDQNCNGSPTDEGLQCRAGEGACNVIGSLTCADSMSASCSATPGTAGIEECNGIDDDCDGAIDDGTGLCPEPTAPTCVRVDFGAFCGCLLDQDCGGRDSGRVCDATERLCGDGCRADGSGNGCPNEQICEGEEPTGKCRRATQMDSDVEAPTRSGDDAGAAPDDTKPGRRPTTDEAADTAGCGCQLNHSSPTQWSAFAIVLASALLRRRRSSCAGSAVLAAAVLSGCGGRVTDNDPRQQAGDTREQAAATNLPGDCEAVLGEKLVSHSCVHATNGTFVDVLAATTREAAPHIDMIHHTYVVQPGAGVSYVAYSPTRDGEHAFFSNQFVALEVRNADSGEAPVSLFEGAIDGCDTLVYGVAVTLTRGADYVVSLDAVERPPLLMFVEHLGTFGASAWSKSCP
jgi:Putative metal-binding motif